ncbi:MAG: succinate dehydrogenase cytochrome b subunit, partial [Gemmatimonadetes bacterium]|nr:succinate dehydrogenase cytochrome b subunit [Gemmatimonadota bacterium]
MMQRVATLYRSSVGKKILMAISGIVLFGFIVLHMVGNLKVLLGPEEIDAYARFLREVGYPAVPNQTALWTVRIVLLIAVFVHMNAAFQTWAQSKNARGVGYRKNDDLSFSYASRTMRWGGVIILLFLIYHILHFTTGTLHPDFVEGGVYHNFVAAFQAPLILLVYLVAQAALC